MNKKSFFLGVLTGIVLTFVGLFVIGLVIQKSEDNDSIQYLENPVSYENKKETSFKVFQVLGNKALADEADTVGNSVFYVGNTVLLLGDNYYNDQVVNVKNPQRVGTFKYITNKEETMTVPIIGGQME